jgi:THAP domain
VSHSVVREGAQFFVYFLRFPRDPLRRALWMENCEVEKIGRFSRICSQHFENACFKTKSPPVSLNKNAVPTLFSQVQELNSV